MRLGFGVILLFLLVLVGVFSWVSWQSEKQDESSRLLLLAELSGKSINAYFGLVKSNLAVLSQEILEEDGTLDPARAEQLIKRVKAVNQAFANIYIADLTGEILASSVATPGTPLPSMGQRSNFTSGRKAMLEGQDFTINRPIFGRIVKQWVIPFRYAVRDKSGQLRYVLNAALAVPTLQSFWQSLYLPAHARMGLLGDDSYLLSVYPSPKPEAIEEVYGKIRTGALAVFLRQNNPPKQGLIEGRNPVEQANYNYAYYRLPDYPVTFFIASPHSNLQQKWWKHNQSFYLLTLIFSMSGLFVYFWMARRNTKWKAERKHQEEKFRSVFEGSNDAIILLTQHGVFDCNQRTLEIFGQPSKAEFIACPLSALSPPTQPDGQDSASGSDQNIMVALRQGSNRFEWVCRRRNGENFPAEVLLSAFDFDGSRILQATVHDITQRKKAEAQLHATLEHLQAANAKLDAEKELNQRIVETSPVGITIYDAQGNCLIANPAMAGHVGIDVAQVVAQNYHRIASWKHSGLYDLALQAHAGTKPLSCVISIITSSGKHARLGIILCTLDSGGERNLMLLTTDLTESMLAKQALEESEERFYRVVSEAPIPIIIHAEDGEVLEVNKVWTETTGYALEDIPTTKCWTEKAYGRLAQQVQHKIKPVYGLGQRIDQGEFTITCKDGSTRVWNITAAPVGKLPDGRRYAISTAQDITERKAAQKQVEFLAYHDFLTGLPNRMLAKERFELALSFAERENTKVALAFLDLDKFKIINDSLGHWVGDALLKTVSARLKSCLRDTDTLCRQGGDEFLVVLSGMPDLDAISIVAEKILARLQENFSIEGNELSTSLSIGIAVYPDDGADYDTLLKKADIAMYQSKEAGRNTYRFYAEQMNVDVVENLQIRNNLRKGLAREEFVLHYQPQIDLRSNAVIGAEALIRWNHPEFGLIPPGRFIPLAEESGLIVQIGEWVLLEACRQAVAWRNAGLPELVVAVNLSAVQFKRGDLEKSIIDALTRSGLNPALLELELTESILIHDTDKVLNMVQRLKMLGVKLSIDDFGTGYSSLSYLKSFAVDKLKIDQSFVRNMADDFNDSVIVRTIIQMARNLGLKTIAEGVETKGQLALLKGQHCDEAQGYHFARPMPAGEFAHYLSDMRTGVKTGS